MQKRLRKYVPEGAALVDELIADRRSPIAAPRRSVSEYVLDASALLAAMFGEPGAERVIGLLPVAEIGSVNLAEIVAKLQARGVPDSEIERDIAEIGLAIVSFDREQAMIAGKLRIRTRSFGLSLGERACLALATSRGLPAVTTDRGWAALNVGPSVIVARGIDGGDQAVASGP